jgi:hypothetical protein
MHSDTPAVKLAGWSVTATSDFARNISEITIMHSGRRSIATYSILPENISCSSISKLGIFITNKTLDFFTSVTRGPMPMMCGLNVPFQFIEFFDNTLWTTNIHGYRSEVTKLTPILKALIPDREHQFYKAYTEAIKQELQSIKAFTQTPVISNCISDVYEVTHADRGSIGDSCMQDCSNYYKALDENTHASILYMEDNGYLQARCLLWQPTEVATDDPNFDPSKPNIFADRLYFSTGKYERAMRSFISKQGMYKKALDSIHDIDKFISPIDNQVYTYKISIPINPYGYNYCPYFDMMSYYHPQKQILHNQDDIPGSILCRDTEGGGWGIPQSTCDDCNEFFDEDDLYSIYRGGVICQYCADRHYFYSEYHSAYIHEEDAIPYYRIRSGALIEDGYIHENSVDDLDVVYDEIGGDPYYVEDNSKAYYIYNLNISVVALTGVIELADEEDEYYSLQYAIDHFYEHSDGTWHRTPEEEDEDETTN